jgi:hypothetical protein
MRAPEKAKKGVACAATAHHVLELSMKQSYITTTHSCNF